MAGKKDTGSKAPEASPKKSATPPSEVVPTQNPSARSTDPQAKRPADSNDSTSPNKVQKTGTNLSLFA